MTTYPRRRDIRQLTNGAEDGAAQANEARYSEPERSGDRCRLGESFCGGAAGPGRRGGAGIHELYRRSGAPRRLAGRLRDRHGGDGIDRGVLDTLVRVAGVAGPDRVSGQCPACEERLGAQVGRAGLPMAPAADELRFAVGSISTQGRDLRVALDHAAADDVVVLPGTAHPAHAKGALADEHPAGQCHFRRGRRDRPADLARHHRRRARPTEAGRAQTSAGFRRARSKSPWRCTATGGRSICLR